MPKNNYSSFTLDTSECTYYATTCWKLISIICTFSRFMHQIYPIYLCSRMQQVRVGVAALYMCMSQSLHSKRCEYSYQSSICSKTVIIKCVEILGFEPRASYMQSKRSTAELHPLTIYFCREHRKSLLIIVLMLIS